MTCDLLTDLFVLNGLLILLHNNYFRHFVTKKPGIPRYSIIFSDVLLQTYTYEVPALLTLGFLAYSYIHILFEFTSCCIRNGMLFISSLVLQHLLHITITWGALKHPSDQVSSQSNYFIYLF